MIDEQTDRQRDRQKALKCPQADKGIAGGTEGANTKTNGSEMASLEFQTQDGALNVTELEKPIIINVKKNPDIPIVQLVEMNPNDYGRRLGTATC